MNFVAYTDWQQLPEAADQLFLASEQKSLFLSRAWFENLTAHALTEHCSLLIAYVEDQGEARALLPLMSQPQETLSSLRSNFTTLHSLLIHTENQIDTVLDCLAEGLFQLPFDHIRFEPVDAEDLLMQKLSQLLNEKGYKSHSNIQSHNWTHSLHGQSFEAYMAKRPAKLRNTLLRKKRRLQREHNSETRLFMHSNIDQALNDYTEVYRASWKPNELFSEFTPQLVRSFAQLGWLRLAVLYIDKHAAAAQIWFVVHQQASIFRLVYDEYWKDYSPGTILTEYLMHHVIEIDKVRSIDFLTGNEHYKQDWMSLRKEKLRIFLTKRANTPNLLHRISNSLYRSLHQHH